MVEEANATRGRLDELKARIDGIASAATTANTTVGLEVRMQQLELAAKRLEEECNAGLAEVGKLIQNENADAQGAFRELRGQSHCRSRQRVSAAW